MIVQRGSAGNNVTMVQTALRGLGYGNVNIDGIFGPITEAAVMDFQRGDASPVTGVVDDIVYGRMQWILGSLIVSNAQHGLPAVQIPYIVPVSTSEYFGPWLPAGNSGVVNGGVSVPTVNVPTVVASILPSMSTAMMIGIAALVGTIYYVSQRRA